MVLRSSNRISRVPPYLIRPILLLVRGCHPLWPHFPMCSDHNHGSAGPRSLAATNGVSIDVLSSGYLDVSVPRVCLLHLYIQCKITLRLGFPIRKFTDQSLFAAPRDLSQRITSFIACACQGIHQMPLRHLIVLITIMRRQPCSKPTNIWLSRSVDCQISKLKRQSKRSINYSVNLPAWTRGGLAFPDGTIKRQAKGKPNDAADVRIYHA